MRKSSKFIVVAGALAALAVPSVASANVAVDSTGSGYVGKGDVQTALKWSNGDFDKNVANLKFTGGYTTTFDNVLTCGTNADNKVVHVPVTSTSTGDLTATAVKSSNGKQITGWNLTGASSVAGSNDLNAVMQATFTACLPDKPYSEMTPEEMRRLPVKVVTPTEATVAFDGLQVNGIALPNTPVL